MVEWQHDWHLLRMVNKEELDMVRTYLKDEVIYETVRLDNPTFSVG